MKKQNRVLALVLTLTLAFVMTLSLAVNAFADSGYTIKINETKPDHTFNVYQIFKGDLKTDDDGTKTLSNITWGKNIDEGKVAELSITIPGDEEDTTVSFETAAKWAEWLDENQDKVKDFARAIAKCLTGDPVTTLDEKTGAEEKTECYEGSVSDAGYYLIMDELGEGEELNKGDALNSFILQVVGDVDIAPKNGTPEVGKEVLDANDSDNSVDVDEAANKDGWGDTADHDIGDTVSFRLTGSLPDNYSDYKSYKYIFHDTLSKGLTYNGDAKVYAVKGGDKIEITDYFTITPDGKVEPNGTDTTITISCDDLKGIANPVLDESYTIVVEYTATLNNDAVIGNPGNPNEVYLEYSSDPKYDGDGDEPTNETPEEKVVVYTYELDVTKVDEAGNNLAGAEFTLEKFIEDDEHDVDAKTGRRGYWKVIDQAAGTPGYEFKFVGLDDGNYRLTETKNPDGYNILEEPIYFDIVAGHTLKNGTEISDGNLGTFEAAANEGTINGTVENKSGSNLPSTGGIGTTIFYIVGGLIVVLTGVLLITKSRMRGRG
ncbi:MAG: SpaH/EbpB family LPXTG-anchored major pilin [Oscillospiraceae bacterium]|nr:SpaH/EbpB family LPXTG-anchored major pilin [Oscillospiraceae bacterium]